MDFIENTTFLAEQHSAQDYLGRLDGRYAGRMLDLALQILHKTIWDRNRLKLSMKCEWALRLRYILFMVYSTSVACRWKTHSPLLDSLSIKPSSIIFFRWVILCSSSGAMIPAVSFWRSRGTREGKRRMSNCWLQVCQVKRAKNDMFIYPDGSTSPTIDPWDKKCIPSNSRRMVSCEFSSMSSILA